MFYICACTGLQSVCVCVSVVSARVELSPKRPLITVAGLSPVLPRCKKWAVPIEKIYNKTQREKFAWAIDMAEKDFEF